ncbi:MAG: hypothetical protein M3463_08660 [Verrucomicrobiota bacterium]|nr:hypothetical protein [Verrucomicrobiota bacterium]
MNTKEREATPWQLALLAALLNPDGCRQGKARDAVYMAISLFDETVAVCEEMAAKSPQEQLHMLAADLPGSPAAGQLHHSRITQALYPDRILTLTLARNDDEEDTLRPYLAEKLNLEGRTGRKVWSRVRTVRDNLQKFFIDRANRHNRENADRIKARELREEQLPVGARPYDERWYDGEADYKQSLAEWAKKKTVDGTEQVVRYEIPQALVDDFIEWRRDIRRQKGGVKTVRQLTRGEVFAEPCQKKIPKRQG